MAKRTKDQARFEAWRMFISDMRKRVPPAMFESWCLGMGLPSPDLYIAAKYFNLDESTEAHRALLLGILADLVFGARPKGRRPAHRAKWGRFRLVRLAVDREKISREAPQLSDTKAAAILKGRFPKRYRHDSAVTLRQKMKDARSWLEHANQIRADRKARRLRLVE